MMHTVIAHFKTANPNWTMITTIVIDKDFTEISVLEKEFPEATVYLCQFHVVKWLKQEVQG